MEEPGPGKCRAHPVWDFLDFVKQGAKKAIHKCKFCGLEKEGISATRWAVHILGRSIGCSANAGISACTGGNDKTQLKEARKVIDEHVRHHEEKDALDKAQKYPELDRARVEREATQASAAGMQASTQPKPNQAQGKQSTLNFSTPGKHPLLIPERPMIWYYGHVLILRIYDRNTRTYPLCNIICTQVRVFPRISHPCTITVRVRATNRMYSHVTMPVILQTGGCLNLVSHGQGI